MYSEHDQASIDSYKASMASAISWRLNKETMKREPWLRHKKTGNYFQFNSEYGTFQNEFGAQVAWSGIYDDEFLPLPVNFHWLWENDIFSIAKVNILANQKLIATREDGFRFVIKVVDYQITIPFYFKTTDKRVAYSVAEFKYRSGKLIDAMTRNNPMLSINFQKEKPELKIDHTTSWKTILSE